MAHELERNEERNTPSEMNDAAPPLSEWLVAALGLVLLCASVAYLGWQAFTSQAAVPEPTVRVLAVEPQNGQYLVRVRVTNQSRATAAALRVEGVLRQGGQAIETSGTEFQYLPGGSSVQGGIYFTRDPRQFELVVAAKGFEEP
jgi:uncharacterized protein (TIGR02588 family)